MNNGIIKLKLKLKLNTSNSNRQGETNRKLYFVQPHKRECMKVAKIEPDLRLETGANY